MRKSANESGVKKVDYLTTAGRVVAGLFCVVTDYDQVEGGPLATCEIPWISEDLASV